MCTAAGIPKRSWLLEARDYARVAERGQGIHNGGNFWSGAVCMPVKIAVLKETRPNETRVAMVPSVADKLAKLGAEVHMQSGAGVAVKLPDTAFKNVKFVDDTLALVRDADVVVSVQPPDAAIVN